MNTQTPATESTVRQISAGKIYQIFKRPPWGILAFLCVTVLALACLVPLSATHTMAAMGALIVSALFGLFATRSRHVAAAVVIVTVMLIVLGGYSTVGMLIAIVCLIGAGAFLRIITPAPVVYLLALAAFGFSYAISGGDLMAALVAISPFPVSLVLAYSIARNASRLSTICRTCAALVLVLAVLLALAIVLDGGALTPDALSERLDWFRQQMEESLSSLPAITPDGQTGSLDPQIVRETVSRTITMLPGTIIFMGIILAFLASTLVLTLCRTHRLLFLLSPTALTIDPSLWSAIVYLFVFLAMLFATTARQGVTALVIENLFAVFSPLFQLVGLLAFLAKRKLLGKEKTATTYLGLAGLIFFPNFAALYGAIATIKRHFYAIQKKLPPKE